MSSVRDLAVLVRAPAALSVPGDAIAGAAASGVLGRRTVGLAGASICLYWAGMAANDWADREADRIHRPERPIPSGRVSPGVAVGLAAALTAAGLVLAAGAGGRRSLAVAVPLAAAVWAYDLKLKDTAAGPAGMALCRGLDVLLGASPGRLRPAVRPALVVAAHTCTVTALSLREVAGADPRLPATTLVGTAAVAAVAGAPLRIEPGRARQALPVAFALWYAARYGSAQRHALGKPTADRVRAAVVAGIVALPALQGALAAAAGAPLAGTAVAAAGEIGCRLARAVSPT